MREAENNADGQHGRERTDFLDEELKRVSPEDHLFAGRGDKKREKIREHGWPGKIGHRARDQMTSSGEQWRAEHERRGTASEQNTQS